MARICPDELSQYEKVVDHPGELKTLKMLQRDLPSYYTVFHSINWASIKGKKTQFGEIDFIVLNAVGELVLIEQKNGQLSEVGGDIVKNYGDGGQKGKSVFNQLTRSRTQVQERWSGINGRFGALTLYPIVYLPDYHVRSINSLSTERGHVIDASEKNRLAKKIKDILGDPKADTDKYNQVLGFLLDSYKLTPDIHSKRENLDYSFKHYSEGLVASVNQLEITPYRLKIDGTAGCGKTLLAADAFHKSVRSGHNTLYLCYNRPLADYVRQSFPEPGKVFTWFGFVDAYLKEHGQSLDFSQMKDDKDFWIKAQEKILEFEVPEHWKFDTVIIDEGQDFESIWWDLLRDLFLKDFESAKVLWMQDSDQNLRQINWSPSEFRVVLHARKNYRSPHGIATYIKQNFPFDFDIGNEFHGGGVQEVSHKNDEDLVAKVESEIRKLLKEGFSTDDIVILSCGGAGKSAFNKADSIAGLRLKKYKNEYSPEGRQMYTEGELLLETVNRFKGQQAAVVFLVDTDLSEGEKFKYRQMQAFVGMTRATYKLYVFQQATS